MPPAPGALELALQALRGSDAAVRRPLRPCSPPPHPGCWGVSLQGQRHVWLAGAAVRLPGHPAALQGSVVAGCWTALLPQGGSSGMAAPWRLILAGPCRYRLALRIRSQEGSAQVMLNACFAALAGWCAAKQRVPPASDIACFAD